MRRRLLLLSAAGLGCLPSARAQTRPSPRRIGLLAIDARSGLALKSALAELGLLDGRDIFIERREGVGRTEALPALAAELVALKPAVIVTYGPQATQAALAADPTVQVVALVGGAIEYGLAQQLARPGGRLTGVSFLGLPLNAKRLELLAELLPKGSLVMNLGDPGGRTPASLESLAAAANRQRLATHDVYAGTPQEIEAAFVKAAGLRVRGINVLGSPFLNAHRARIIELAAKNRLPAIYQWPHVAREGGLMAYGPSLAGMDQLLSGMVVRVLNGTRAGDLPIEQPTRFELVINLATARALGLSIPQTLLLRADEVIE